MTHRALFRAACVAFLLRGLAGADDWNQWRGPDRNGVAPGSPRLRDQLPDDGLQPVWMSEETIPAARDGGWGSPVVAAGRVYLFTHSRVRLGDAELPQKKYPWLPPEKRVGMTDEEYAEYEKHRRAEDFARSKRYRFDEVVYCLDAATGKTIWKNERPSVYTRFAQSGSPAVLDGRVYVLSAGRIARALNAETGQELWATKLPGEFQDEYFQSSFAVAEGVAVVLCGWLFGLDAVTGEILWAGDAESTKGTHTSPVVWQSKAGPLVIVNAGGGQTVCIEPSSGAERWRVDSQAGYSTPVVAGDLLVTYGNSRKKGLRCFRMTASGAELLWVYQGCADSGSSPVVIGSHVYVQGEKRLACVSLENGQAVWTTTLDLARPRYASLAGADNKVFYAWEGLLCFAATPNEFSLLMNAKFDKSGRMAEEQTLRRLLKLDEVQREPDGRSKAERLWRENVGDHGPLRCTSPAIADGKIFLRMENGIACYDLKAD